MAPHNLTMTVWGAGMLWVGWFGFNGGSALAANGQAAMAMLVTHLAAAAGCMAWMSAEWIKFGKPSVLGIVTGMVAGLGTITPAAGFVGPGGAIAIGPLSGQGFAEGISSMGTQLGAQAIGVVSTLVYTAVVTWLIFKSVARAVGLRIPRESEHIGLDISEHEERGYDL